jgi:hypothetical protein
VGKSEGKKPPGRPRRRWADNIKMELREIAWDGMDWIDLVQDMDHWRALVNTVMNLQNLNIQNISYYRYHVVGIRPSVFS